MKKIKYLTRLALTLAAALMLTATRYAGGAVNAARTSAWVYLNDDSVPITLIKSAIPSPCRNLGIARV